MPFALTLPFSLGGPLVVIRIIPAGAGIEVAPQGPTVGGGLVEIYGDGFRLPPEPEETGPSGPVSPGGFVVAACPKTVSVTFGGVESPRVDVIRSNLLRVVVPPSPIDNTKGTDWGAGTVDVRIQNLSDAGIPIPGQEITITNGYEYKRVRLDHENPGTLVRVTKTLLKEWLRGVLSEVILRTPNVDFDADVATQSVDIARLPAIVLQGPKLEKNRFYSLNGVTESTSGTVRRFREKRTVDLVFDVVGISDSHVEMINLMEVATKFMHRTPYLTVNHGDCTVRYEMNLDEEFEAVGSPNESSVASFNGTLRVVGVDLDAFAGMPQDEIADLGTTLTEGVSLDAQRRGE